MSTFAKMYIPGANFESNDPCLQSDEEEYSTSDVFEESTFIKLHNVEYYPDEFKEEESLGILIVQNKEDLNSVLKETKEFLRTHLGNFEKDERKKVLKLVNKLTGWHCLQSNFK